MRANAQLGGRDERVALEYWVISPETLSIIYYMCTIWGQTIKTPGSELSGLPRPGSSEKDTPCRLIRTPNSDPPSHDSPGRLHEDSYFPDPPMWWICSSPHRNGMELGARLCGLEMDAPMSVLTVRMLPTWGRENWCFQVIIETHYTGIYPLKV